MPDDQNCNTKSLEYYSYFMNENIETLYDDRNCSVGKKLSDNDLIGTPIQIIIGKRDLAEGLIEVKDRILDKTEKVQIDDIKKVALEKLKS